MGAPEEHVKKSMGMVLGKLKEVSSIKVSNEKSSETSKIADRPFWSMFSDVELEFTNLDAIMGFCLDFMPSSLEILEPLNFEFGKNDIEQLWNDLIGRLHHYDMMVKNLHAENVILKRKMKEYDPKAFEPKGSDLVREDKKE